MFPKCYGNGCSVIVARDRLSYMVMVFKSNLCNQLFRDFFVGWRKQYNYAFANYYISSLVTTNIYIYNDTGNILTSRLTNVTMSIYNISIILSIYFFFRFYLKINRLLYTTKFDFTAIHFIIIMFLM